MTKVFVSYHHENDQGYKDYLSGIASCGFFEDKSVKVGDIGDDLSSETIRQKIRDEYLQDTQVTILLCGRGTRFRKHIDWELKSSMIDGKINRRSGILIIDLPSTSSTMGCVGLPGERRVVYPDYAQHWNVRLTKNQFQLQYPAMPERIIDNLVNPKVRMSVVQWHRIERHPRILKWLIDASAAVGYTNEYDLTLPMRKRN